MHELSVAMSLVDIALEEGRRDGGRVRALHLRIGQLVGVMPEILINAFTLASHGTDLEGVTLEIEEVPAMVNCPRCGGPRPLISTQAVGCGECGFPVGDFTQGREFELAALEIEG